MGSVGHTRNRDARLDQGDIAWIVEAIRKRVRIRREPEEFAIVSPWICGTSAGSVDVLEPRRRRRHEFHSPHHQESENVASFKLIPEEPRSQVAFSLVFCHWSHKTCLRDA